MGSPAERARILARLRHVCVSKTALAEGMLALELDGITKCTEADRALKVLLERVLIDQHRRGAAMSLGCLSLLNLCWNSDLGLHLTWR